MDSETSGAVAPAGARQPAEPGLAKTRAEVVAALPGFIAEALRGYRAIVTESWGKEGREAAAHQSACRQALAHLEMLLKLARGFACERDGDSIGAGASDPGILVAQARTAIAAIDPGEDGDEEETP